MELSKKEAMQMVVMQATLNSKEIYKIMTRDMFAFKKSGETATIYSEKSLPELIVYLLDNRKFDDQPDEIKRKMVHSEYYPESAKTDKRIYLDDQRNLAQELHNKLCAHLSVPETKVQMLDFKDTEMDIDMFEYYDPADGIIYLNSAMDYSQCERTEFVERIMHATYSHQIIYEMRKNLLNLDHLSGEKRYIVLSEFLKRFCLSTLKDEEFKGMAKQMQYNDGYSTSMVYAIYSTYNLLNKIFEKSGFYDYINLETFQEDRQTYMASLLGDDEDEEEEDPTELEGFDDLDEEDQEVLITGYLNEDGILYDTVGYDLDMLYTLDKSELNHQTEGFIFETLITELDDCSKDFYEFFGAVMEESFAESYKQYKEEEEFQAEDE